MKVKNVLDFQKKYYDIKNNIYVNLAKRVRTFLLTYNEYLDIINIRTLLEEGRKGFIHKFIMLVIGLFRPYFFTKRT